MNCSFQNNLYGNYLLIQKEKDTSFEVEMIMQNKIDGILSIQLKQLNDLSWFSYNISEYITLEQIYKNNPVHKEEMFQIISNILKILEVSRDYLLQEDNFIIDSKYIYANQSSLEIYLIFCPENKKNISEQFIVLTDFFMNKVDYSDEESVVFAYGLFKLGKEGKITHKNLMDLTAIKNNFDKQEVSEEDIDLEESDLEQQIYDNNRIKKNAGVVITGMVIIMVTGFFLFFATWKFGLYNSDFGGLNYLRLAAGIIIILAIMLISIYILLSVNNNCQKTNLQVENKNSDEKYNNQSMTILDRTEENIGNKTELLNDSNNEKTTLLCEELTADYYLKAEGDYEDIQLIEFPFFIGKIKSKVNGTINNDAVSRFHAKIENKDGFFFLTDLKSTNGTFLNGVQLKENERKQIYETDIICFANAKYQFINNM